MSEAWSLERKPGGWLGAGGPGRSSSHSQPRAEAPICIGLGLWLTPFLHLQKPEPRALQPAPFSVVVAIDFGTTSSGYAFSFASDPEAIHMMR